MISRGNSKKFYTVGVPNGDALFVEEFLESFLAGWIEEEVDVFLGEGAFGEGGEDRFIVVGCRGGDTVLAVGDVHR